MNKLIKRPVLTLLFSFLVYFTGSFFSSGLFAAEKAIWEAGNNVYFKYADQDDSSYGTNDHPVDLDAKEISTVLESLKTTGKDQRIPGAESKPVFTDQQTKLLGQYLAKGFKNATPDQDIVFVLERSVSRSLGLKADKYFVAGRAFFKDNKLNIIIGDYDRLRDHGYEAAVDPTHVGIVRYNFDHGKRSKRSKQFNNSIVTVVGIENAQIKNNRRHDWVMIDMQTAIDAINRQTSTREKEAMAKKRQELKEILGTDEPAKAEKSTSTQESTQNGDTPRNQESSLPVNAARSLEKRLTTLKILRDKGLITDEEYTQKRKQILDDL